MVEKTTIGKFRKNFQMKKITLMILAILLISNISASCEDGQIDINSATKTELMKLIGIGEVKSQAIIDYRENKIFKSVDELIDVYGIGEVTLKNIKTEESKNESGNNYAFYGFVFFCILLLFLFILKIRKDRNNKNEFKE